jgi:UDP-galactopyranose mutase
MAKKAIIVGAGFGGCMYAYVLRQKGWDVTVIEKEGYTGGGVRTFFHGGHPFTYGPRHFLSPFQEAYEFLNKHVPMRDLKKINYTFMERDQAFYTYPIHEGDLPKMPDRDQIQKELDARPENAVSLNFETFWVNRVGPTLYDKFVKHYNMKAWQIPTNTINDDGFEGTLKKYALQKGDRYEYDGWFNSYPIAYEGYNSFFDKALEGCQVLLNTTVEKFDLDGCSVYVKGEKLKGDLLISTLSPDALMGYEYGELKYVGREFYKIMLPIEEVFPKDVYFLYYPNPSEQQTRIVEYKKLTQYKSPQTLMVLEVPSMKNKLYPTMIKAETAKAKRYLDSLPKHVHSVGRMGRYKYIDMDDIIVEALQFSREVI